MSLKGIGIALFAAACALGATASGCATSKNGTRGRSADGRQYTVICRDEAPTGSHISRFRCYRKFDVEQRRANDRAEIERMESQTMRTHINSSALNPNNHFIVQGGGYAPAYTPSNNRASR